MEIYDRIKLLREASGLSQQQVADALGNERSNIRNWELRIRRIKAEDIIKIADFFNVSADYLLGREGHTYKYEGPMLNALEQKIRILREENEKAARALNELEVLINGK